MALLPKSYRNGKRIKVFKYNGVEIFEANYIKEKESLNKKCYHKHKGIADQTTANGCYQKKVDRGECSGHRTYSYRWTCGRCGSELGRSVSEPSKSSCPMPDSVCAKDKSPSNHDPILVKETFHDTSTGCSNWKSDIRYDLDCGYDEDDGT